MKRRNFVVLVAIGLAVSIFGLVAVRREAIAPVKPEPVVLPFRLPSSGYLERQVAGLIAGEVAHATRSGLVIAAASEEASTRPPVPRIFPQEARREEDQAYLARRSCEFAYVSYGKIGATPVATLLDTRTGAKTTEPEGAEVYGLRLESVTESYVVLSFRTAVPIRKPRIEIEIDNENVTAPSPEEIERFRVRYEELWGNRTRVEDESEFRNLPGRRRSASSERNYGDGPQHYLNTFGPFVQRVRSGDPGTDPREFPSLPTVEESMRETLRAYSTGTIAETAEASTSSEGGALE